MDTPTAEPTTVGEMLRDEFLKPLDMTQLQLAVAMGTNRKVISQILANKRRLTVPEASKLSQLFGMDSGFWINLQSAHDRWEARRFCQQHPVKPLELPAFAP